MISVRSLCAVLSLSLALGCTAGEHQAITDDQPLVLPQVGAYQTRLLSPTILELTLITTKKSPTAQVSQWDFVNSKFEPRLPKPESFLVSVLNKPASVRRVGFKRRVLYAPFKQRDLRIGNYLYLELAQPVPKDAIVEVKGDKIPSWPSGLRFSCTNNEFRFSPVIHVNETGYQVEGPKIAMVGYYLGNLGEMDIDKSTSSKGESATRESSTKIPFSLLDAASHREVFRGELKSRRDSGFPYESYQRVLEADFTKATTPGEYQIYVPGLGVSFSFFLNADVPAAFARANALGIYHQRCGTENSLPFTRFVHGPCHTAPVAVPLPSDKFEAVNEVLKKESADFKENPRHTAPQMVDINADLYPFVNKGPLDVRGGHHDAGDYSKYTINSAGFLHILMTAVDVFPGVKDLDNLGIPESGDHIGDILQEAKWEADFLAKMQDADGGFYFLVYPREREYETDVTPDHGDPQLVFPKTTSVTAAAVAALAQCASSPALKKNYPEAASAYLEKARKGWQFLEKAIAKYGKDGAYQKITHYGNEFMHDDELAWAACELFLATGEDKYHKKLIEWLKPNDPETRKWGWLRLYDAYGCAIRSYALAAKAGKIKKTQQDRLLLEQCEDEIVSTGEDQARRAQNSAYGTSFPEETKRARAAGWYFSSDAAFDLAVASQLDYPVMKDPRPKWREAILSNLNYEQGCNPVNVTYLTGLGWHRQREIVDQYAQNDRRVLPPSGIPLGNVQAGFGWLEFYQKELGELCFPADGDERNPYPIYDRWGDSFNLSQEFVILNQARALAYTAWLMTFTPSKAQPWKPVLAQIRNVSESQPNHTAFSLEAPGFDLSSARIVWEAEAHEPFIGLNFSCTGKPAWVEAEAQFPDGRRIFAVTNLSSHLVKK